jgi:hypothetical protein
MATGIRKFCVLFAVSISVAALNARAENDCTVWTSGSGNWTNAAQWSSGLPNPYQRTEVHGVSTVIIPPGDYIAGDLEIGLKKGDRSRVELDGGRLLLLQDSLRIGELSDGAGEFILKDGALHCFLDVYVGAANSVSGRETKATLQIQAGSFVGRTLLVGSGPGAESVLAVEGSRASAVHALEYFYLQAFTNSAGKPGNSTLAFTLDEHGVTPITIQSRHRGFSIIKDAASRCRLKISLNAIPPRDDVTLVSGHVPIQGTFDDLPEGSEITAQYQGRTYRWQLTYHGGTGTNDLVLKNRSEYTVDAPVTHARPMPEIPKPLWTDYRLYPLSAETNSESAFPGAEGFGAFTPGGRGGKTIFVDNLNDSGPGSLRAAVETPGPRLVVFQVGGAIPLKSTLIIQEPFLTIDGQNAPGAGILLRDHGIEVRTHDVVLRYFRVRVGDDEVRARGRPMSDYRAGSGEHALYFIEGSKNCIADHLSLSWSTTKILSVTKLSDLITVQWCILSEALNFADHGYASLAGGNRVTWHHNLFAHNLNRNVRFQGPVDADFRNNVIYDWGGAAAYGEFDRVNYVGNYLKAGPSTRQWPYLFFHIGDAVAAPGTLFVTNNFIDGEPKSPGVNTNNWRGMGYYYYDRATLAAPQPFPAPPVATETPQDAYEDVLKNAGATLPRRDAVDERIVNETRSRTGHIINWVKDVGGWPDFPSFP